MKTNKNQKSMNNKGFSLVELIVVIAIMAVLVAVLAPQFTKYIDRSRQSNDASTVSGIVTAAEVAVADIEYDIDPGTYIITVSDDDTVGTTVTDNAGATNTAMETAISDACGELGSLVVTANAWNGEDVVITLNLSTDGAVTVTYAPQEFADYIGKPATPAPATP